MWFLKRLFSNIRKYLNNNLRFNVIGSQYTKDKMDRPAYGLFGIKKINPEIKKIFMGYKKWIGLLVALCFLIWADFRTEKSLMKIFLCFTKKLIYVKE